MAPVLLRVTADDFAKLFVNGTPVCQGSAAGYPEHHYYVTVDIAPCLHPVENVLAAHLYYQGLLTACGTAATGAVASRPMWCSSGGTAPWPDGWSPCGATA